ncbi:MAG: hydroxymethylglutaryl-CoA reductase [Saprospiraceae bacterium]
MDRQKTIAGFSKLTKIGKIKWLVENFFKDPEIVMQELKSYWLTDVHQQELLDGISENTISNYPLPLGIVPNFVLNGKTYAVPMVIEESSVVAAASSAAKYWMSRGGIKAEVIDTIKVGHVHFYWGGDPNRMNSIFLLLKPILIAEANPIMRGMIDRGGGLKSLAVKSFVDQDPGLYQLFAEFDTCDSMGANFINTVLEQFSKTLQDFFRTSDSISAEERELEVIMAILSNYTPDCLVKVWVECPVQDLTDIKDMSATTFAERFYHAIRIAHADLYRATTHNKGIFNGIDAVALATGNDFRSIEACGHAYAAKDGRYKSLSSCSLENDFFKFVLQVPLAVGTVGGLTKVHPIAKRSLELMENPNSQELMMIIAGMGLIQNFAAVRSLVTTGIQQGHMKMHLNNILHQLNATSDERTAAIAHFQNKTVSMNGIKVFLDEFHQEKIKI